VRQDEGPTRLLRRWVETSNTSLNGIGALSVADGDVATRSVATLKELKNPAAQIMRDSADMMIKFGSRFGLSLSDRTRLSVAPREPEGPDAQVLSLLS